MRFGSVLVLAAFATGVLVVALVFIGNSRVDKNDTARIALCALRDDLDRRIDATNELFRQHPQGSIFGIPRSVLRQSRDNSIRTRRTLDILDC